MGLISKVIAGFFNGMSQQPPALRLDTQCEEEINGWSSLVDGTTKRPPTEHIATLTSNASQDSFVHTINRDSTERYTTVFTGDATEPIEIFKQDGTKCTVQYGNLDADNVFTTDNTIKNYVTEFTSTTPQAALKSTTVADYTLVVNKNILPVMSTFVESKAANRALVSVKSGVAETTYKIFVNGSLLTSVLTSVATNYANYKADAIAERLITTATPQLISTYNGDDVRRTFTAQSSALYQVRINGAVKTLGTDYTVSGNEVTFTVAPRSTQFIYDGGDFGVGDGVTTVVTSQSDGVVLFNGSIVTGYTKVFTPGYFHSFTDYQSPLYTYTFAVPIPLGVNFRVGATKVGGTSSPDVVEIESSGSTAYTFVQNNSSILITRADGLDFDISVWDSWGQQALSVIKGSTQKFSDLPYYSFPEYLVEITGDPNTTFDNYFVKFDAVLNAWIETRARNQSNALAPKSLPHRLVRTAATTFTFAPIIWEERKVGNDLSNPVPSFIGKSINDIFFYKNRLGMLAGENLILSKSGDFFNFFAQTVTTTLDDDPIDIAVSTNEVATLYHAQAFNNQLILFSDQMQFIVNSNNQNFTSKTVAIDMSTHFATDRNCRPVSAGANVYFVSPRGANTSIKEYFVQATTITNDAADVTAHVPRLLPANPIKMVSSSTFDTLFVLCKDEPFKVYVYKYYWSGDQKAQSSWSVWEFSNPIINIDIIDTKLQLIMKRYDTITYETIELNKVNTGVLPFRVHLDRLCTVTGTYNSTTNLTKFVIPYYMMDVSLEQIFSGVNSITGTTTGKPAHEYFNFSNETWVYVEGDFSSVPYHIGEIYNHSYEFSEWFLKAPNSNTGSLQGRLQMRSLTLNYTNTGYFKVEVTPSNRDTITHEYNASLVGITELGTPSIVSETRKFLLLSNAQGTRVKLVNDSYLPSEFHSASFEGYFTSRNQPV